MSEPLARSPRQVAIADHIWETFNSMSADMGVDRDGLINQALFSFARQNGYLTPQSRAVAEPAAAPLSVPASGAAFVPAGAPGGSLSAVAPFAPPVPSMPAAAPVFAPPVPSMPAAAPVFAPPVPSMPAAAPVFPPSPSLSAASPFAPSSPASTNQGLSAAALGDLAAPDALGGLKLNLPSIPSGTNVPNLDMAAAAAPDLGLGGLGGGAPDLDAALAASDAPGPDLGTAGVTGEPPAMSAAEILALFADGQEIGRVTTDRFLIGRGKHCDLVIHSGKVSREHAAIMKEGGQYFIEDLGSSNGTWFDKKRITKRQISDGEEYFVCSDKITFRFVA
jgi:hypothetical protein